MSLWPCAQTGPQSAAFPTAADMLLMAPKCCMDSGGQVVLLCVWGMSSVSMELRHEKQDTAFWVHTMTKSHIWGLFRKTTCPGESCLSTDELRDSWREDQPHQGVNK